MGGEKHQVAVQKLISVVTNPLLLTYPDFSKDFILHVVASKDDLGCALYQQQQDQLRVIEYGIRTLAIAEKRYHISKMEYLALKYVAYDDFKSYIFYAKYCEVFTDNKRLLYATSTTNLNATGPH